MPSEFLRAVQLILGYTFCVEEDECIFTEARIPLFLRLNRVFTRNYPGCLQRSLQRTNTLGHRLTVLRGKTPKRQGKTIGLELTSRLKKENKLIKIRR